MDPLNPAPIQIHGINPPSVTPDMMKGNEELEKIMAERMDGEADKMEEEEAVILPPPNNMFNVN